MSALIDLVEEPPDHVVDDDHGSALPSNNPTVLRYSLPPHLTFNMRAQCCKVAMMASGSRGSRVEPGAESFAIHLEKPPADISRVHRAVTTALRTLFAELEESRQKWEEVRLP